MYSYQGELLLLALIVLNLLLAFGSGFMEGVIDHHFYNTEFIVGIRKHIVYMTVRAPFWIADCLLMSKQWHGWELAFVLCMIMLALLLDFKFIHDGVYHETRNELNPDVSPNGFKQDDDGLSGSLTDHLTGRTYRAR